MGPQRALVPHPPWGRWHRPAHTFRRRLKRGASTVWLPFPLTKVEFSRLTWGKCKFTNVKEQAAIRAALASGAYRSRAGQILFAARHYSGDLKKAYYVARSLLDDGNYALLGWRASDAFSGAYGAEAFDLMGDEIDSFDDD